MTEGKWTLIDKKTQFVSWIILVIGFIIVGAVFFNLVQSYIESSTLATYFFIGIFVLFVVLVCFLFGSIISRFNLKKSVDKKLVKKANITIIIRVITLAIFLIIVLGILSLKPYDGISIKDINSNPKDYENKTVTIQAWFNGYSEKGSIYQEDYFSDKKDSMRVYIDENVDKSMLFPDREYLWTGIITVGEYVGGDLYAEMEVTKISTLYDDLDRHNISRLVGSWKEIEYNNEPYTKNTTWTFNQNNTLKVIHINRTGVVTTNSCEHFAVDDDLIYYEISSLPSSDRKYIYDRIGNYYLSENDTILTIETDDGYLVRVFQKI